MSKRSMVVRILVLGEHNATVAEATLLDGQPPGSTWSRVMGSAKREPGDIYDQDIADNLAVGRALEKLGRQLQHRGNAQVALATHKRVSARIRAHNRHVTKDRGQLPVDVIRDQYGKDAADRAAARRGPAQRTNDDYHLCNLTNRAQLTNHLLNHPDHRDDYPAGHVFGLLAEEDLIATHVRAHARRAQRST